MKRSRCPRSPSSSIISKIISARSRELFSQTERTRRDLKRCSPPYHCSVRSTTFTSSEETNLCFVIGHSFVIRCILLSPSSKRSRALGRDILRHVDCVVLGSLVRARRNESEHHACVRRKSFIAFPSRRRCACRYRPYHKLRVVAVVL